MHFSYFSIFCLTLLFTIAMINADDTGFKREKTHFKKDPRDYTERDVDSLYEEWEDNDEDILPEDERHDYYLSGKNRPKLRPEDLVGKEPEHVMKISKKGSTLMMFATVSGSPTRRETEEITQIWWLGLKNALYDVNRHVIDDNRILLVMTDGSQAFEIKDFLIKQDRCKDVTIDNRVYPGKGAATTDADKEKKKQDL